ncbi:MAG: hypothetical protein J5803_05760, partial [Desulfovibrio sp.]|nr:hypothetical protein [Desulfovibrio sp.]
MSGKRTIVHWRKGMRSIVQILALSFCLAAFCLVSESAALGLGEAISVSESGVVLSDGYGGPLPSAFQIAQLGACVNQGFNQEAQILALLLQELAK